MDAFNRKSVEELLAPRVGHCVSITMPRRHIWADSAQDQVRFKNLLTAAQNSLQERGLAEDAAHDMLAAGWKLQANDAAWRTPGAGLAMFAAEGFVRIWQTPVELPEAAVVDRRFYLVPLIAMLEAGMPWFLLAFSQKKTRLFRGDRFHLEPVDVPELPTDIEHALNLHRPDRTMQVHGGVSLGKGGRTAVFHGQGGAADYAKDELLSYSREVDRALHATLRNRHEPLLFAGVEYLYPIYRKANTYPHLADEHVSGNPDELSGAELHARGWPLMAPRFERQRDEKLQRLAANRWQDGVASLEHVLAAAEQGRVDTLFATPGEQRWGEWNATATRAVVYSGPRPGAEELVNRALVDTLRQGGRVWGAPPAGLPRGEPVAAVLRYAETPRTTPATATA